MSMSNLHKKKNSESVDMRMGRLLEKRRSNNTNEHDIYKDKVQGTTFVNKFTQQLEVEMGESVSVMSRSRNIFTT